MNQWRLKNTGLHNIVLHVTKQTKVQIQLSSLLEAVWPKHWSWTLYQFKYCKQLRKSSTMFIIFTQKWLSYFFLAKKTFPKAPRLIGFRISKSSIVGAKLDEDDGFLMKESDDPVKYIIKNKLLKSQVSSYVIIENHCMYSLYSYNLTFSSN